MNLRECYEAMGANYDEMLSRIGNERLILKFLKMFLDDGSFIELQNQIKNQNAEEAFKAAHTLKGVALNLALTKLANSASVLTEELRDGAMPENAEEMMNQVSVDYEQAVSAIGKLD